MTHAVYLASDHAGFELKEEIAEALLEKGYPVVDKRAFELDSDDDYPSLIRLAIEPLAHEKDSRAIILGGSGQGEAIVANRVPGVRAAVYYGGPLDIVKLSREHNDANVLSLGARFLSKEDAIAAALLWLDTPFSQDARHVRRIADIDKGHI